MAILIEMLGRGQEREFAAKFLEKSMAGCDVAASADLIHNVQLYSYVRLSAGL